MKLFDLREMEHSIATDVIHPDEWQLERGSDKYCPGKWRDEFTLLTSTEKWESEVATYPSSLVKHDDVWRLYYHYAPTDKSRGYSLALAEYYADGSEKKYPCAINSEGYFSLSGVPGSCEPMQANVFKLEENLYRMYFWCHDHPATCRFLIAESPNGRNFKVTHRPAIYHYNNNEEGRSGEISEWLRTNDATTVYRMPDGTWELYTACFIFSHEGEPRFMRHDVGTGSLGAIRLVQRFTSPDGINWDSKPRLIAVPDEKDIPAQQFYGISVSPCCNGLRYGVLSHYNADEQTNDFENVISRDSIKWERHCREAALERTEGIYGLYPAHNFLTSDDGRLYLLHVKYNCTHNHKIITNGKIDPENVISSIDPLKYIIRKVNGAVITPPWRFKGKTATLPVTPGNSTKVELLDVFGEKPQELTFSRHADGIVVNLPELEVTYGRFRVSGDFEIFSGKITEFE